MARIVKTRYQLHQLNLNLKNPKDLKTYKKEYMRIFRKENPEVLRTINRKDYLKHRKKRLTAVKKWKEKNYDRVIKRKREHYAENRERLLREKRERYWADPKKANAIVRKSLRKKRLKLLQKIRKN